MRIKIDNVKWKIGLGIVKEQDDMR